MYILDLITWIGPRIGGNRHAEGRLNAAFYEGFGHIRPPGIGEPRVFRGIPGTWCSNPSCFTVPAATRISGTTYFCGFPATGVPNMQCFLGYSGGRGRPLSRGTPRGRRKASGGRRFGKHVKTRWFRGPGAPNRVKNAYERCTPHEAVGQTVLPTASGVSPPGSRDAIPRGLRPFWPSPAGSVAGSAHRAVEAKFRPTAVGGVRAARVPFRGSILLHSYVFYRPTRCGSGAQT